MKIANHHCNYFYRNSLFFQQISFLYLDLYNNLMSMPKNIMKELPNTLSKLIYNYSWLEIN
jgi:hypothetical protein